VDLAQLVYDGEPVGCRLYLTNAVYDMDMDAVKKLNIRYTELLKKVEFKSVGSSFISIDELNSGIYAKDISDDILALTKVGIWLKNSLTVHKSFVPKPCNYREIGRGSLEFKLGLSIILVDIYEEAGETGIYSTQQLVNLVFETKTALIRVCSILGGLVTKRRCLSEYDKGNRLFQLRLPDGVLYRLKTELFCSLTILKEGYTQSYLNRHDGMEYKVTLVPPYFDVDYSQFVRPPRLGSIVNGISLQEYIKELKEFGKTKWYNFYPNLSMSDVTRLWGVANEFTRSEESSEPDSSYA
jgi:hypothetical protein